MILQLDLALSQRIEREVRIHRQATFKTRQICAELMTFAQPQITSSDQWLSGV